MYAQQMLPLKQAMCKVRNSCTTPLPTFALHLYSEQVQFLLEISLVCCLHSFVDLLEQVDPDSRHCTPIY